MKITINCKILTHSKVANTFQVDALFQRRCVGKVDKPVLGPEDLYEFYLTSIPTEEGEETFTVVKNDMEEVIKAFVERIFDPCRHGQLTEDIIKKVSGSKC